MQASTQFHLGPPQSFEGDDKFGHELPTARGRAVREACLGVRPRHLLRVEVRRVRGELRHPHARMSHEELTNDRSSVDRTAVPEHDDGPAPGAQQRPQERADLGLPDVLRVDVVAEPQAMRVRADREAADDREAIPSKAMAGDRTLAARRPRAPQVRNELKSGLIDEDQERVTGLGVFSAGVATLASATPRSPARSSRSRAVRASAGSTHAAGASDEGDRGGSELRTGARSARRSVARSTTRSRTRAPWPPCEALAAARATARDAVSPAVPAAADVGVAHRAIAAPNSARTRRPRRAPDDLGDVGKRHPLRQQRQCLLATTSEDFGRSGRAHPSRYPLHTSHCIYLARRKNRC